MNRLACIVEGQGEVLAVPKLCQRILAYLQVTHWLVNERAMRYPRGQLVDARHPSPLRPCVPEKLDLVVRAAQRSEKASAVVVLCDADDDCPATWGPDASRVISTILPGGADMPFREYEAWLLWNRSDNERNHAKLSAPEQIRDAKGAMARFVPNYRPTAHQLEETKRLDVAHVRARSDSFDKLVRILATLCGVEAPPRPTV